MRTLAADPDRFITQAWLYVTTSKHPGDPLDHGTHLSRPSATHAVTAGCTLHPVSQSCQDLPADTIYLFSLFVLFIYLIKKARAYIGDRAVHPSRYQIFFSFIIPGIAEMFCGIKYISLTVMHK
jgi:hypothetical protein